MFYGVPDSDHMLLLIVFVCLVGKQIMFVAMNLILVLFYIFTFFCFGLL